MSKEFMGAVFIGRMQPLHNGHAEIIEHGLKIADKVLVIVGSANKRSDIKNPMGHELRADILKDIWGDRVIVDVIEDHLYSDKYWHLLLRGIINRHLGSRYNHALLGTGKDISTAKYILEAHSDLVFIPTITRTDISSTKIRDMIYAGEEGWKQHVPERVVKAIGMLYKEDLIEEYRYIQEYKSSWSFSPYPPSFYTADAVVLCNYHIAVIRRGGHPGKGSYALPGGFVGSNETAEEAARRELREEAAIDVQADSHTDSRIFDHPDRSLRGRTISNAFFYTLVRPDLPWLEGGDDASEAMWMSITDFHRNRHEFFGDHAHIIEYFINVNSIRTTFV